jgi:hypothetical protein
MLGSATRAAGWLGLAALCVFAMAVLGQRYAQRAVEFQVVHRACLNGDVSADGQPVVLSLWTVTDVQHEQVVAAKVGPSVPIVGLSGDWVVGDVLSVEGRCQASVAGAPARVIVTRFQRHPLRPYKAGLSTLGVGFALIYVGASIGIGWRRG